LQNYWIKNHNIDAIYEKEKLNEDELEKLFVNMRNKKVNGANVTVPFKKAVIPFLDKLSAEAKSTQAVNTIYLENDKLIGHNTDIDGFELGIRKINYNISNKKIFILGAGGVVPSIIYALNKMKVSEISIANRTREKAENLKKLFGELKIVEWGEIPDFDMIINATSIGLKKDDEINLNFSSIGKNKLFYDVIYNPKETNFLKTGKELGNVTENGKLMFIYQAISAFNVWHGVRPMVNDEVIKLLD
jgi:shikimate dehydrogenase